MIKLLDTNKQTLHLITQVKDYYIESEIETADKMIHFLVPKQDASYVDLKQENYLRTEDDEFVIKEINYKEKDYIEVFGKLNVEGLRSKILPTYESVGRPLSLVMSNILAGTGWAYLPTDVPNTLRTIRTTDKTAHEIIMDCMNLYNLEVEFDSINKRVRVYQQLGEDRGSYIHNDLNLKKVEFQSDTYDYRTRLYAYGKDGLTIAAINGGKEYVDNNTYSNKIVETIWRDDRYTDIESLKADAIARLEKIAKPRLSYVVDVIQLTTLNPIYSILDFKLGDTVKIMDKELELIDHQRVVKLTAYPITPEKNKVHLGDTQLKFNTEDNNVEDIIADKTAIIRTELMTEIDRVSELIGAPETGFVVVRKNENGVIFEQLIMDTDDVATAAKVWRWNINGLGYSSTGYNGDYRVAITMDGTINADFITTGNLDATLIKAGLLMSNDGSTWIDMDTGSFNLKNALVWDSSKNKMTLGSNVEISWDYIADAPTIPTSAEDIGALPDTTVIPTSAEDIGAKPADWVPTWDEIKDSPTILSANDIKTTVITKDWIGTLGLMVGDEIQMGSNARITWANVDDKPTIPSEYSDAKALNAWINSGYSTHINSNGVYTGTLAANKILIGGANGSISFTDLSDKPWIPQNADDIGARPDTWTPTAEDVGARPSNWTPTAAEVGAKASTWFPNWDEVTGKPNIQPLPSFITSTKITATTIESPSLYAGTIAGSSISAADIYGGTITGPLIRTALTRTRLEMDSSGLSSFGSHNGRNGVNISGDDDFGSIGMYKEVKLYQSGTRYTKGDRVYTAPVLSAGVHYSSIYVYIANSASYAPTPPNTSYWLLIGGFGFTPPAHIIPEGTPSNYIYYTLSRSYSPGMVYCVASFNQTTGIMSTSTYQYKGSTRTNPPAPPNTTYWNYIGTGEAEGPSSIDAVIGPVTNVNNYLGTNFVGAGIQSYFKHIQLKADKIGSLNDSGNVILTSTYGSVIGESRENLIMRSEKDVVLTTDYVANSTVHPGVPGHIVLRPYAKPSEVGEVRIGGYGIIRSEGTGSGKPLVLRAGTNGSSNDIQLYGAYISLNGTSIHTSDIKLKENINTLDSKLIDVAQNINFINFNFKNKPDKIQTGVIAQWVEEEFAKQGLDAIDYDIVTVHTNNDDGEETKYVNYDALMMLKIAALERRIIELEQ